MDSLLSSSSGIDAENSGSTAVVGLLQGKKLTTAWAGDSRGIVGYYRYREGGPGLLIEKKAPALSLPQGKEHCVGGSQQSDVG